MTAVQIVNLLLAVPAAVSLGYFPVAAFLLARWQRTRKNPSLAIAPDADLPPVTFFRPLKAGVPDLAAKLEALVQSMHPGDQLLLGVAAASAEEATSLALQAAFPIREIEVVRCPPGAAQNPKISKLVAMVPSARHEHWILSDSESVLDAVSMDTFRREWAQCDVLTAGYRFSRIASWPQRLDAAAPLLTLWPGLAVLCAAGPLKLTLGACTGLRRRDLMDVGGWSAFGDDLAEDNRLGKTLSAQGRDIRLSRVVLTLDIDPLSWHDYWRHQRRVAVTYRVASPAGFAGAIFTQGVTTGFLLALFHPSCAAAWLLFAAVFAVRCLTVWYASKTLRYPLGFLPVTVFFASIVETICWALSWFTHSVWWSGRYRRVSNDGRFARDT